MNVAAPTVNQFGALLVRLAVRRKYLPLTGLANVTVMGFVPVMVADTAAPPVAEDPTYTCAVRA